MTYFIAISNIFLVQRENSAIFEWNRIKYLNLLRLKFIMSARSVHGQYVKDINPHSAIRIPRLGHSAQNRLFKERRGNAAPWSYSVT